MEWAQEVAAALDAALPDGEEAAYDEGFGPLTATVPAEHWLDALTAARDTLGCAYFDWLSAVDELAEGFAVVCHLARLPDSNRAVRHLLVRSTLARESPVLTSAVGVFAGAAWHERETTEMFGIVFVPAESRTMAGQVPTVRHEVSQTNGGVRHLLLPDEFEGHPLRKDFVLVSRVAKPWPGAKEPGESDAHGGSPSRRRTRPPGVPDEEQWGPRDPGSPDPDPLAHAQPGAARPRRARAADRDDSDATRRRAGRERHAQREGEGESSDG